MDNLFIPKTTGHKKDTEDIKYNKDDVFTDFRDARRIIQRAESIYLRDNCYGPPQCLKYAFQLPQVDLPEQDPFDIFFDRAIESLNQPKDQTDMTFDNSEEVIHSIKIARKRLHLNDEDTEFFDNYNGNDRKSPNIHDFPDIFQNVDGFDYS